ncbi:hypothetical protein BRARA_K01284 [Brassica rapa]|uniref:Uncharacterized protein n=1 Tax=Brassica campestris TaxID=3711 RepID=A0A397KY01_BRACM|nr:hypothetical protein BRARA_K01284 [Brassica rapa]
MNFCIMFSLLRQLKNNPFYRLLPFVSSFRSGNEFSFTQVGDDFKLGRWMSLYSFLSHVPDTHGRSMCSSLYESHNPVSTHLLRSTMIAESVLFSSDKDASEGSTSAVENKELAGVSVTFQKSLFHRGACWRLCDRIEFPSKDKIQHAL